MPRYFFDTGDGDRLIEDDEGLVFADDGTARREALAALPDIARSVIPDDRDRRVVAVRIRNDAGGTIYSASLALTGEWCIGRSS